VLRAASGLAPGLVAVAFYELPRTPPTPDDERILSSDEGERAQRFSGAVDRHRFVHCRATLRRHLGSYADCEPEAIRFDYGPRGKPMLEGPNSRDLHFNLSHADEAMVIAFAIGRPVGVDIERVVPVDVASMARVALSDPEQLVIKLATNRLEAFYALWTRKEAYLKARGLGLGSDLRGISVLPPLGLPAIVDEKWLVTTMPGPPGYAAAVAYQTDQLAPR
jgi:4'-phosphopantetheinyl transferase